MNDRELLELAAKAAGMTGWAYKGLSGMHKLIDPSRPETTGSIGPAWNPLTDDGDALRLAVKLNMEIQFMPDAVRCRIAGGQWIGETCLPCDTEYLGKAQRRAITRTAAAEIARAADAGGKERCK